MLVVPYDFGLATELLAELPKLAASSSFGVEEEDSAKKVTDNNTCCSAKLGQHVSSSCNIRPWH